MLGTGIRTPPSGPSSKKSSVKCRARDSNLGPLVYEAGVLNNDNIYLTCCSTNVC